MGVIILPSVFIPQLHQQVVQIGSVCSNIKMSITQAKAVSEIKFPAAVIHDPHVPCGRTVARICRNGDIHQHACGIFLIPVHGESECTTKKCQVQTYVCLGGLFPPDIGVRKTVRFGSCIYHTRIAERVVVTRSHGSGIFELAYGFIPVFPPGSPQFPAGKPLGPVCQKVFVGEIPSYRGRRENGI